VTDLRYRAWVWVGLAAGHILWAFALASLLRYIEVT
jgi:hypothetical protein